MSDSRAAGRAVGWGVVVPVKGGPRAKSRLAGDPELARAFAADTLEAVAGCERVTRLVVVSGDDAGLEALLPAPRPGLTVRQVRQARPGLEAAVRQGVALLAGIGPQGPGAVLLGDLPALRSEALTVALDAATEALGDPPDQVFVPDARGTGTVLLAARRAELVNPAFGERSAAAHRALGAHPLALDLPGLRQDVDTVEDLQLALRIGLGPRTRAALDLLREARTA